MKINENIIPTISVIVPVYNASKFLRESVESILNQTFLELEVILIDDGSSDNSLQVCMEYQSKDSRVRVFHQNNSGVSSARNYGLEMALGEFIFFADSDDLLEINAIDILYSAIKEYDGDLVCASYYRLFSNGNKMPVCFEGNIKLSNEAFASLCYSKNLPIILGSCWGKLYRKSIINHYKLKFPIEASCYEDNIFNIAYYSKINCAVVLKDCIYNYRENLGSISFHPKKNIIDDFIRTSEKRKLFWKSLSIFDDHKFATRVIAQGAYLLRYVICRQSQYLTKLCIVDYMLSNKLIIHCVSSSHVALCSTNKEKFYIAIMKTKSPKIITLLFLFMDWLQGRNKKI